MLDLHNNPFFLSDEDIKWVHSTLSSMTMEEKVSQLFCVTGGMTDPKELTAFIKKYRPGGFMYRAGKAEEIQSAHRAMQRASRIPLLLACNLESGGNGVALNGTFFGREMEIAASDDPEQARRLGIVCAREGYAAGCNWALAPIVDIDYNWRNPITNVRTFGSDPERVLRMSSAYLDGVRESGAEMAVCIKHFPGDGVDERDQHLLPTVNSLGVREWESTYGRIYSSLIKKGAQTVMGGHILQPAMTRKMNPQISDPDILPASSNRYLLTDLLRGQLGFNGLITTDATPMVGFSGILSRREAISRAIMGGADVILFCKNMEEDLRGVCEDVRNGVIKEERLDEAVIRQLALKASLKLHQKQWNDTLVPPEEALSIIGCREHEDWARECADKAITLVKDNQNLLPLFPEKTRRIRLTVLGENQKGAFGDNGMIGPGLKALLERNGFIVSLYDYETLENGEILHAGVSDMKKKFDLSIVAANIPTGSNNTTRRVDWVTWMAADEPWYMKDIPTMFISFCNPYHMFDVPFISTFINCYSSSPYCMEAAVEKMLGKSAFVGKSPVDPWCGGIWGARYW